VNPVKRTRSGVSAKGRGDQKKVKKSNIKAKMEKELIKDRQVDNDETYQVLQT